MSVVCTELQVSVRAAGEGCLRVSGRVLSLRVCVFACAGRLCVSVGGRGCVCPCGLLAQCVCIWVFVCLCGSVMRGSQVAAAAAVGPRVPGNTPSGSSTGAVPLRAVPQPSPTAKQRPQPLPPAPARPWARSSVSPSLLTPPFHSPRGPLPPHAPGPAPCQTLERTAPSILSALAPPLLGTLESRPHCPLFQEALLNAAPSTPCFLLPTFLAGALGGSVSLRGLRGQGEVCSWCPAQDGHP